MQPKENKLTLTIKEATEISGIGREMFIVWLENKVWSMTNIRVIKRVANLSYATLLPLATWVAPEGNYRGLHIFCTSFSCFSKEQITVSSFSDSTPLYSNVTIFGFV